MNCGNFKHFCGGFDSDLGHHTSFRRPPPPSARLSVSPAFTAETRSPRAAYNRAQRLEERRKIMRAWADYLDGLKAGGKVVPIRRKA